MDLTGWRDRADRTWQTLRRVPPRQLLRRVELLARYRLMDLVPAGDGEASPPMPAPMPPLPPFAPRPDLVRPVVGGLRLRLPWGERTVPLPIAWTPDAASEAPADTSARADLNNLQFMEFLESVEDDAWFMALIDDWIAGNPRRSPGSWRYAWRPYNLSVRVVVWMQELAQRRGRLDSAFLARTLHSLAEQLRFLERHLETDLHGNHLIKNLRALLWAGAFFQGPEAERWRRLGQDLLADELDEQILADGMHYERSPAYHCQVLNDFLDIRQALPARNAPHCALYDRLDAVLARMGEVAGLLCHPDGGIALFNDGGLGMARAPRELRAAAARLAGTVLATIEGPFALPAAGYWGLRRGGDYLILDCGPLGPAYLSGHGHGDALSFEWSTGGRRIIVDQGTYQYAAGDRRRQSRSTLAHNTVSVDGAEQSDLYGAFRCGRRAETEVLAWRPQGDGFLFEGTHDGFAVLPGAPRHRRRIEARPGELRLLDRVLGEGVHRAEARFLLHPDCTVRLAGAKHGEFTARIARDGVEVELSTNAPIRAVPAEWYPDLYRALPTQRLIVPVPPGETGLACTLRRRTTLAPIGEPAAEELAAPV
jgi:uncharacterized heparinase superfamily protein